MVTMMTFTEEQYYEITDELDAHDFFCLGDLAGAASNSNLLQDLDNLHNLSKRALEYAYLLVAGFNIHDFVWIHCILSIFQNMFISH